MNILEQNRQRVADEAVVELQDIDISGYRLPTYRGVRLDQFTKDDLIRLVMWQLETAESYRQEIASRLV